MPHLRQQLELDRCPHCKVDTPSLRQLWSTATRTHAGDNERNWAVYQCSRCGGLIIAASSRSDREVTEIYPEAGIVSDSIPAKAREFLNQAINSLHAPAGAIMLAASAVDAMLKEKGYDKGGLKSRIDRAAKDHLITREMSRWAHQVRLDANEQRHADQHATLPTDSEAQRTIEFALALAEYLFVLPSRITRGLEDTEQMGHSEAE